MKKISLLLAILIMAVTLAGCGTQKAVEDVDIVAGDLHSDQMEEAEEAEDVEDTTIDQEPKYLNVISDEQLNSIYPDEDIRDYVKEFLGDTVPNIEIRDLEGNAFDLESLRGKDYVLEFMGTWCPACKSTSPHIEEFKRLNPDKEVFVITFSDTEEDIIKYKEENELTDAIYMVNLTEQEFKELYKLRYVPTFFFVDKEGITQFIYIGDLTTEFLEDMYYGSFGYEETVEEIEETILEEVVEEEIVEDSNKD